MSEQIRCQMCGKLNPADAETCRYCHARLKPLRPGEVPPPESAAESEDALPPWMQTLREETAPDTLPETDALPLDAEASRHEEEESLSEEPSSDEILWAPPEGEAGLPDWLESFGDEGETAPSPAKEEVEAQTAVEEASLLSEEPLEGQAEGLREFAAEEDTALPDWLEGGESEAPVAPESREEALPDWLTKEVETLAEEQSSPAAGAEEEAAFPEWLQEAGELAAAGAPESEESGLPDWLAKEMEPAPASGEVPVAETPASPEAEGEEGAGGLSLPVGEVEETLPDWLVEEGQTAPEEAPAAETPPPPSPFTADLDLPLELLQETPDWLAMLSPEREGEATAAPAAEAAEGPDESEAVPLAPGELPPWVEALRPTVIGEVEEEEAPQAMVETEGPLAGLRGVLTPAQATVVKTPRVAPVGGRLFLTDRQEAQVGTLQALLAEEFAPREPVPPPPVSRQRALRWFMGGLLLLVAFLPLLLPSFQAPPPSHILPAARAALQAIDALQPSAPVLVGVDYSPAFAAEMEAAAVPLLRDLLAKRARLTVVSTQPVGPALAAHLFDGPLGPPYQGGRYYLDLGYLPGGTAGLFAFAQNPRLVFGHAPGYEHPWETPFLKDVHRLSDFAMVVVITEDADTARAWIEQVRPSLQAHTPLIAVISAQAEPMVEPYYETASHQVAGVVTGMAAGMAYRVAQGQPSEALLRGQWSSYSDIVLFAALIVAAAGLYNLALGWREMRARRSVPTDETDLEDSEEEEA